LPGNTLIELCNSHDDVIPFIKFKRFSNDSPEGLRVGFDMNTVHIHAFEASSMGDYVSFIKHIQHGFTSSSCLRNLLR